MISTLRLDTSTHKLFLFFCALACLSKLSISEDFSWMAFQERDLARSAEFILNGQLSHIGPEVSWGGYLPGPALTLLFAVPLLFESSPIAIFLLLQFSSLISLVLTTDILARTFSYKLAILFFFASLFGSNLFNFSIAGWHAALAPCFVVCTVWTALRFWEKPRSLSWILVGFLAGISQQIHVSTSLPLLILALMALIAKPSIFLRVVPWLMIGFLASLSYYIVIEFQSSFENTKLLFNAYLTSIDFVSKSKNLDIWNYIHTTYFYYTALNILPNNAYLGNEFFSTIKTIIIPYSNYIQLTFVIFGLFNLSIKRKRPLFTLFLLIVLIYPIIAQRPEARHYMYTGICWVFLFTLGFSSTIEVILKRYRNELLAHFILICFLAFSFTRGTSEPWRYTIYYTPYSHYASVFDVLLNKLSLKPIDYEQNFYFYRGDRLWPFWTGKPLPSKYMYRLKYKKQHLNNDFFLNGKGIIVLESRYRNSIELSTVNVIKELQLGDFIAIIYSSPYIFRMVHQYSDEDTKNKKIIRAQNRLGSTGSSDSALVFTKKIFTKGPSFNISMLLSNDAQDVVGFAELNGKQIRQSSFAEQSPYFLIKPNLIISKSNGQTITLPIVNKHFYINQKINDWEVVYKKFGSVSNSQNVGSLYLEAPFGRSIKIDNLKINDIQSISFTTEAYGNLGTNSYHPVDKTWIIYKKP